MSTEWIDVRRNVDPLRGCEDTSALGIFSDAPHVLHVTGNLEHGTRIAFTRENLLKLRAWIDRQLETL